MPNTEVATNRVVALVLGLDEKTPPRLSIMRSRRAVHELRAIPCQGQSSWPPACWALQPLDDWDDSLTSDDLIIESSAETTWLVCCSKTQISLTIENDFRLLQTLLHYLSSVWWRKFDFHTGDISNTDNTYTRGHWKDEHGIFKVDKDL